MNKIFTILLIALIFCFSQGKVLALANTSDNNSDSQLKIEEQTGAFNNLNKGKESFEIKIHDQNEPENNKGKDDLNNGFTVKGAITASSLDSITINNQLIKIDSSVTGDVKIVGKIELGAYAMVKGKIVNSDFYAKRIVVDQRNKKELGETSEDKNTTATVSATPTPTITADDNENATMTAQLDFGNIINTIQNFLNYLKDWASKI